TRARRSVIRPGGGCPAVPPVSTGPALGAVSAGRSRARMGTYGGRPARQLGSGEPAVHAAVPRRMVGVLPTQPVTGHGSRLSVQRDLVFHRLGRLRRAVGRRGSPGDPQQRQRGVVPALLRRGGVPGDAGTGAAARRTTLLPGGGSVFADEQGVEPTVLAVAGATGCPGDPPLASGVRVDGPGRAGVGTADVLLSRSGGERSAAGLVPGNRDRARSRCRRCLRTDRPRNLPAVHGPGSAGRR